MANVYNRRHLIMGEARIGTQNSDVHVIGFTYIVGTYNTVVDGQPITIVETPAMVATADFFLEAAQKGLVRTGDLIAVMSGTEKAPVVDATKKIKVAYTGEQVTGCTLIAR